MLTASTMYALEWHGSKSYFGDEVQVADGFVSLCEIAAGTLYLLGTREAMAVEADKANREAARSGHGCSTYRAVPIPFAGEAPDHAFSVIIPD